MDTETARSTAAADQVSAAIPLNRYGRLMESMLSGRLSATDFERRYLDLFKADGADRSPRVFGILDALFAEVDAFCPDPDVREPDDLDEEQLRQRVAAARTALAVAVPPRRRRAVAHG